MRLLSTVISPHCASAYATGDADVGRLNGSRFFKWHTLRSLLIA